MLTQLARFFPSKFNRYFEPFLGSAAVFFFLRRTRGEFAATLMDANAELINCYACVREQAEKLLPLLSYYAQSHGKDFFYTLRDEVPVDKLTNIGRAARFIYLNKTCYNGLYRVNRNGKFNVPIGSYKKPGICDEQNLKAVAHALHKAKIRSADFSVVVEQAKKGDFVYFDPPYYTDGSGFTGYAVAASGRASFGAEEHYRLMRVVVKLAQRGCHVVVSNSNTETIRRIYKGFRIHTVTARRFINCDGKGRSPVEEVVITSP